MAITHYKAMDACKPVYVASADGALGDAIPVGGNNNTPMKNGMVLITKATAAALTLRAPVTGDPDAGGEDGRVLTVIGTTAQAHVITTPANKINGGKLTATFANVGDAITLVAYGGIWYAASNTTTLA